MRVSGLEAPRPLFPLHCEAGSLPSTPVPPSSCRVTYMSEELGVRRKVDTFTLVSLRFRIHLFDLPKISKIVKVPRENNCRDILRGNAADFNPLRSKDDKFNFIFRSPPRRKQRLSSPPLCIAPLTREGDAKLRIKDEGRRSCRCDIGGVGAVGERQRPRGQ